MLRCIDLCLLRVQGEVCLTVPRNVTHVTVTCDVTCHEVQLLVHRASGGGADDGCLLPSSPGVEPVMYICTVLYTSTADTLA